MAVPAALTKNGQVARWLDTTLAKPVRLLIALSTILLALAFTVPMWRITMYATQFPDGLKMTIYPQRIAGGNEGRDIAEINTLNHYIGMRPIEQQNFAEMKWIPFALGVFVLLAWRTAVFGKVGNAVDLLVLFTYFGLFSLGAFSYRLREYGHHLDPDAPIKVPPFAPPLFGHNQLANFDVYSFPGAGSLFLTGFGTLLAVLLALDYLSKRRTLAPS